MHIILHLLHFVKTALRGSLDFFLKNCISYSRGAMIKHNDQRQLKEQMDCVYRGTDSKIVGKQMVSSERGSWLTTGPHIHSRQTEKEQDVVEYVNHALLDGLLPSASLCLLKFPQPPQAAPVTGAQVFKHISFNYHRKFLVFPVFLLITYILKHCLASFLSQLSLKDYFFVIILKFSIYWNLAKVLTHLVPLGGRHSF